MDREQAITELCKITRDVMDRKFNYRVEADCICYTGKSPVGRHESTNPVIIEFIREAVNEKLAREAVNKSQENE